MVRWTYGGVYINHQTEGLIPGKSAMGWVGRGLMWELGGVSKEGQYLFSPDPFLFVGGGSGREECHYRGNKGIETVFCLLGSIFLDALVALVRIGITKS